MNSEHFNYIAAPIADGGVDSFDNDSIGFLVFSKQTSCLCASVSYTQRFIGECQVYVLDCDFEKGLSQADKDEIRKTLSVDPFDLLLTYLKPKT